MKYDFSRGQWRREDFAAAASVKVPYRLAFSQGEDSIHNEGADRAGDAYAYVSMALRRRAALPCRVRTVCSFNRYGAPLILLADSLDTLPDGRLQYGHHIEIVGWEQGVNVWDLTVDPTARGGQRAAKLMGFSFPVADRSRLALTAHADGKTLRVRIESEGKSGEFTCPGALAGGSAYVGITACEGENYFYSLEVDEAPFR